LICGGLVSLGAGFGCSGGRPVRLAQVLRARRRDADHDDRSDEKHVPRAHASAVRYHKGGMKRYDRFADFYPVYLKMHSHPTNRRLHCWATGWPSGALGVSIVTRKSVGAARDAGAGHRARA
jgi:hypothetical protein